MKRTLLSFLVFGAILSATPATVTYVNPGDPLAVNYTGQYYVGPYTLNVNGTNVLAMCMDDFKDVGGTWSANITRANSPDLSNTYLGNGSTNIAGYPVANSEIYKAEAYLFSLITKPNADRVDLQEAAWALMDPATLSTNLSRFEQASSAFGTPQDFAKFDASQYSIISQAGPHDEQEFIYATATPEPGTIVLFGSGFALVGAARYFKKRKSPQAEAVQALSA